MDNKDLDWIDDIKPIIYFENLEFKKHPHIGGGIQAKGTFPVNGKWYSVVGGPYALYGNGIDTFEVFGKGMGDVKGWLSKEEVEEWLLEMQS